MPPPSPEHSPTGEEMRVAPEPQGRPFGAPATEPTEPTERTDAQGPGAQTKRPRSGGRRHERHRNRSFWRELPLLILIALGLALLIKTFVVQAFFIPSASMEPTLHGCTGCSGDRVLVNKVVYDFRDPHRGEIIVFDGKGTNFPKDFVVSPPSNVVTRVLRDITGAIGVGQPSSEDFIKRVIGVGGDTVACCDATGRVTVNGVPLDEPYLGANAPPMQFAPVKVPAGRLFVMGDNRNDSSDSRVNGTVPVSSAVGRAFLRVWPLSRFAVLSVPPTFGQKSLSAAAADGGYAVAVIALPVLAGRRRKRRRIALVRLDDDEDIPNAHR